MKKKRKEGRTIKTERVELTETFTSTRSNHGETEFTDRNTTEARGANHLFSLLRACSN